jgi:hypothetical protein
VDGTKRPIPFVSGSAPWGNGTPNFVRDATLNDSDKTLTVPKGKMWDMKGIWIFLTTTATVGNRLLSIRLAPNGVNYINVLQLGALAASLTESGMLSFQGVTDDYAVSSTTMAQGIFPCLLPAGAAIRIFDAAAIDAAADDLEVLYHYVEYDE